MNSNLIKSICVRPLLNWIDIPWVYPVLSGTVQSRDPELSGQFSLTVLLFPSCFVLYCSCAHLDWEPIPRRFLSHYKRNVRFPLPSYSADFMRGQTSERLSFYERPSLLGSSFRFNMVNFSSANSTNVTNVTSREGDTADVPSMAGAINVIIINTITCPFTVLLNVLVIKAVKSTPRLRTNSNILLACLAVTDALTGLLGQPLFVLWKIFLLFGLSDSGTIEICFSTTAIVIVTASYFHLMLVTLERLLAIKFTMQYPNFVTDEKMKRAVLAVWILAFTIGGFRVLNMSLFVRFFSVFLTLSCILFLAFAYFIIYRETCLQQEKIKTQQLPQQEVERFTRENKALKTTMFVVGAVIICLLPLCFCLILLFTCFCDICPTIAPVTQTCAMLNSLVNPLIYCWRQKEMRKVIFRSRTHVVVAGIQWKRAM